MKHIITIALSILFYNAYGSNLDSISNPTLTFFTVNNELHYLVDGCSPGSNAEFYSKPWGGSLLRTAAVDSTGCLSIVSDTSFQPAFVLNRGTANSNGKRGTGKTGIKQDAEFCIQEMAVTHQDNTTDVYWKGQVYNEAVVHYELLMTIDGATKVLATYTGSTAAQYYHYTGIYDKDAVYTIKVVNTIKGVRYQAPLKAQDGADRIKIYPTAANNFVNIVVPADIQASTYKMADMQGKIVQNGMLRTGKNKLSVNELLPGNYIVFVPGCVPEKIVVVH